MRSLATQPAATTRPTVLMRSFSNTTGTNNTANGVRALVSNNTGSYNTANGVHALSSNTTGNNNTANGVNALFEQHHRLQQHAPTVSAALCSNTTGINNTADGHYCALNNTTGSFNIAIGL